jgi:RHS repeat-associated protein
MRGIRFRRVRLAASARGPWRLPDGVLALRSLGCLVALFVGILVLAPASASAESLCTDTWTGPAVGPWTTAKDWSTGKVPISTDVACIGSGNTVKITEGANQTGVVQGLGTLAVSGGSLELANALETSAIKSFTLGKGTLTGAGTLEVTGSFLWNGEGTMSGAGKTVIPSSASGEIASTPMSLVQRTLVNEGAILFGLATLAMSEGALFENKGTLKVLGRESAEGIKVAAGSKVSPLLLNTGTIEKIEPGEVGISVPFENHGTVSAHQGSLVLGGTVSANSLSVWSPSEGATLNFSGGSFTANAGKWSGKGHMRFSGAAVTAEGVEGGGASLELAAGSLTIPSGTLTVSTFSLGKATLTGAGTLEVTGSFLWNGEGTMSGAGKTVIRSSASGEIASTPMSLVQRTLVNEGTTRVGVLTLSMSEGALFENKGTLKVLAVAPPEGIQVATGSKVAPLMINSGTLEKIEPGTFTISVAFENFGLVIKREGTLSITDPIVPEASTQYGGGEDPSAPGQVRCKSVDPVSCATGNLSETQTDLRVGGRGVGLDLARTYNSQAGAEGTKGVFGYGWNSSFNDHLVVNKTSKVTTLFQAAGSTVPFTEGEAGSFTAPAWTQDTLSGTEGTGYTLTLASQIKYKFAGASGRLESVTDRDGNATTLTYNEAGRLTTITDPTSRTIKLVYNGEGLVESAEDPMKHVVKYTYEGGNLKNVTQPAEAGLRWQFKYDGSHQMTEMTDGREGKTTNEYNASHQVTLQKDPAGRELNFEYEPFHTKITNKTTGSVTDEHFTSNDEPVSITRGFGTTSATTESFGYNAGGYVASVTDGNEHTTTYGYSVANDRTSMVDPNKNETKWTYNTTHDVETMTTPKGETTTIKREAHGNPETIERPAPAAKTQITKYKYKTTGELESVEDPLKRITKYEYDTHGNRTVEIDPATDKRTWEYNEDSQETATVSPRGNVTGGKPLEFTTKIERDNQGRPLKIEDPLKHTTKYAYDGDGNIKTVVDGNSHTTTYTYNGDNQPVKVEAPNKTVTEAEYDGAGQVTSQTDGNKNVTKYTRNPVEEVTEVTDPLARVTKKTYDAVGNLKTLEDPAKRTTTFKYDPANRLIEVTYSSGKPATVTYEYDKDGDRTKMVDGTGTTKYTYDQLDRLTETENGHKAVSKYEYDLANEQTKITYPNGKAVTRAFDKAGRLEKITDWLTHITKFAYNPDSELNLTTFPSETKNEDKSVYNNADQMTEVKMLKSVTETLASLVYTRDGDGQVKKTTSKGLPGAEITENTYDENNRVTKSGTEYKYDAANNPTTIGAGTYKYDKASQLETGPSLTYTYDELGERTKAKPTVGPATTDGYDQAGNLTSVERPKEGETSEIKDTYAYDGNGLRTSQTISGTTTNLAWDMTEGLPLILSDETNSYIYGPGGIPVEQISGAETPTYLHHDQQGSIRLLTGSAGTVTGKCTYTAYGTPSCEGTTTTPLGYDGQYTSTDTGLIYLRARVYDPATAQFLSVDPLAELSFTRYNYGGDNPMSFGDAPGLMLIPVAGGAGGVDAVCGATWEIPVVDAGTCGAAAAATAAAGFAAGISLANSIAGEEAGNDEGEQTLKEHEAIEAECDQIPTGSKPPTDALPELARKTGIPRGRLSDAFHKIKKFLPPTAKTRIDGEGNVYDEQTGENIGNVVDEAHG